MLGNQTIVIRTYPVPGYHDLCRLKDVSFKNVLTIPVLGFITLVYIRGSTFSMFNLIKQLGDVNYLNYDIFLKRRIKLLHFLRFVSQKWRYTIR